MRCLTAANGEPIPPVPVRPDFFVSLKRQDVLYWWQQEHQHGYPPPVTHPVSHHIRTLYRQVITGVNGHALPDSREPASRVALSSLMVWVFSY